MQSGDQADESPLGPLQSMPDRKPLGNLLGPRPLLANGRCRGTRRHFCAPAARGPSERHWQRGRRWRGRTGTPPWEELARTCPDLGALPEHPQALLTADGRLDAAVLDAAAAELEARGVIRLALGPGGGGLAAAAAREARTLADSGGLPRSGGTRDLDPVRSAWLRSLPAPPALRALRQLFELLSDLGPAVGRRLRRGPLAVELDGQTDAVVACYEAGGFQRPHWDVSFAAMHAGRDRRLTAITYLNPGWRQEDGGALRLFDEQRRGWLHAPPALGTLVLFRADRVLHEVQATRAPRMAMTVWHLGSYAPGASGAP